MAMRRPLLAAAIGLGLALAALPALGQEAVQIKVVAAGAVIHAKPDASSQALDRPAIGTLLALARRLGDWYEVRFQSRLGMVLTGYIFHSAVEAPPEKKVEPPAQAENPPVAPPAAKPVQEPVRAPAPAPARARTPGRKILQIGIGGFVSRTQVGDSRTDEFPFRDEALTIKDALGDAGLAGLDIRVGFLPLSLLEVEASYQASSQTLKGTYLIGVPSLLFYGDIATDEMEEDMSYKNSMFSLSLVLHPLNRGAVRPYLGIGLAFCSGSLRALKDIHFNETYYSDYSHKVEITKIEYEPASLKATGYLVKAGLDAALAPVLFLFAEAAYVGARDSYELPLITDLNNKKVTRSAELGGVRGVFGLRIRI
jgi:hypothetical protein